MTSMLIENKVLKVRNDIIKIAEFYNLKINIKEVLTNLESYFAGCIEIVLLENSFELIISGSGDSKAKILAKIANINGLPKDVTNYFLLCAGIFKNSSLGLKLEFGNNSGLPTLYVKAELSGTQSLNFLEKIPSIKKSLPELLNKLDNNEALYGFGFSCYQRRILINIHSTADTSCSAFYQKNKDGFISYSLLGDELQEEIKTYLSDTSLENFEAPNYRWEKIKNFLLNQLNIERVAHIDISKDKNSLIKYKIYIENSDSNYKGFC